MIYRCLPHPSQSVCWTHTDSRVFGRRSKSGVSSAIPWPASSRWFGAQKTICGVCGTAQRGWYDRRTRRVRDLACADTRIYLEIEVRRVQCRCCGAVKRERLNFLADNPPVLWSPLGLNDKVWSWRQPLLHRMHRPPTRWRWRAWVNRTWSVLFSYGLSRRRPSEQTIDRDPYTCLTTEKWADSESFRLWLHRISNRGARSTRSQRREQDFI